MAIAVIMPKQGQSVETCIITRWFKAKGERVNAGDILFSYETDKAAFDLESPAGGILLDLFFGEGAEVPVLENVAVIGNEGEAAESFNPQRPVAAAAMQNESPKTPVMDTLPEVRIAPAPDQRIRISPRAKRVAREKGIDYVSLSGYGSGPNGRIITSDIENVLSGNAIKPGPSVAVAEEYSEQPLSNVRNLIARAMQSSLQNSAQLTHHMSADVRLLLEARRKVKEMLSSGESKNDITLNDMVCWCVVRALEKFPEANSHFLDDRIRTFRKVHLGIAVDTRRGLMVPVVKNADGMNLEELSAALKTVAEDSRKGSISPELIRSASATFTVSNLGNYGVEMFTPVINLPQVGILGVCTIINRPADLGNNIFGFVPYMGLSLTYDHRAIDGGPATLFLKEIRAQIESFSLEG
jgi:pyruvate dehydrogenase E2 component (dihydrolipoyllysine-residue acetyltransferase)